MSRYVDYKHGLAIGSDNIFYVVDRADETEPELELPEGVPDFRDGYEAIVTLRGYDFDQIDSLNVFIRTPAHQLIWTPMTLTWEIPWPSKGEIIMLPQEIRYHEPKGWVAAWLEEHVGARYDKWDTYTRDKRANQPLFFRHRKDALAFVKMIDVRLKGIKIGAR